MATIDKIKRVKGKLITWTGNLISKTRLIENLWAYETPEEYLFLNNYANNVVLFLKFMR